MLHSPLPRRGEDVKDMPVSGVVRTWVEGRRVCSAIGRGKGEERGGGKRGDYWLPDCQVMSRATDT